MTVALIKAGRPDPSCARACYVDRLYSSAFVVTSFVLAYATVFLPTFRSSMLQPSSRTQVSVLKVAVRSSSERLVVHIYQSVWRHIPIDRIIQSVPLWETRSSLLVFGAFAHLRKATVSLVISGCPSVLMSRIGRFESVQDGWRSQRWRHIEFRLTFRRRIKSRLPFAGIIRRLTYSTRFQDKG